MVLASREVQNIIASVEPRVIWIYQPVSYIGKLLSGATTISCETLDMLDRI